MLMFYDLFNDSVGIVIYFKSNSDYEAFLYLVTDTGKIEHSAKNLKELYKN